MTTLSVKIEFPMAMKLWESYQLHRDTEGLSGIWTLVPMGTSVVGVVKVTLDRSLAFIICICSTYVFSQLSTSIGCTRILI